ncbi:MAG: zinc finger MYND domain-containing protein [Verrucomicrobia bacterium]|nr:zinc finger MYND domain-containing protein [Verrucomicrobiota bacterium]
MAIIAQNIRYQISSYEQFKKEVLAKLDSENTLIKYYAVSITFYTIKGQEKQQSDVFGVDYTNHVGIAKDDRELYELLKKEFSDTVKEKKHQVSAEQYQSQKASLQILQGPLESPQVQQCLRDYRINRRGAPLEFLKEDLQKIPGEYRKVQDTKRLCQKMIQVIYIDPQEKEITATYQETFETKCNQCSKMETVAHKLHMCTRCHEALYCNRECQTAHWRAHKLVCLKP